MSNELVPWLEKELQRLGWSQSELAKRARLNRAIISKILNGYARPTPETLRAIARALGYPQEFVFRKAGLITDPLPPGVSLEGLALAQMLSQLPPDDQEEILTLVQLKLSRQKRRGPAHPTGAPNQPQRSPRGRAQNPAPKR